MFDFYALGSAYWNLKLRLCTRVASRLHLIMSASASKSADTSKADQPAPSETEKPSQQSQLGALEEDDEFEEFPAQGTCPSGLI